LLIFLSFCIKNFRANKHNEVLNKHKQNALSTFETFVKTAGEDKSIKNAILLETTHSIFSSQNTGYTSSEKDIESNKIIEIIKNITEHNS
jgi:hypothetical protein